MESVQQFERTHVSVRGREVAITSWYEPDKQRWRANAPAFLHLLGGSENELLTGLTRDKAVLAISGILTQRLGNIADSNAAAPARRSW